jgi:hypothetical protein
MSSNKMAVCRPITWVLYKVAFQGMQVSCIFKVHGFDKAQHTALMLKWSAHFKSIDCKDLSWTSVWIMCIRNRVRIIWEINQWECCSLSISTWIDGVFVIHLLQMKCYVLISCDKLFMLQVSYYIFLVWYRNDASFCPPPHMPYAINFLPLFMLNGDFGQMFVEHTYEFLNFKILFFVLNFYHFFLWPVFWMLCFVCVYTCIAG